MAQGQMLAIVEQLTVRLTQLERSKGAGVGMQCATDKAVSSEGDVMEVVAGPSWVVDPDDPVCNPVMKLLQEMSA